MNERTIDVVRQLAYTYRSKAEELTDPSFSAAMRHAALAYANRTLGAQYECEPADCEEASTRLIELATALETLT